MNKTPATLIAPSYAHSDADNLGITQYQVREGAPYLSGAEVVNTTNGPWGVPYWMRGIAMQTCNNSYITAPTPWQKSLLLQEALTLYSAGQAGYGSAPTSGIYTGVEDHCS